MSPSKRPLIDRVSGMGALTKAWNHVRHRSSPDSRGPDEVTREMFARNSTQELKKLSDDLKAKTYRPIGYRGVAIKKKRSGATLDPRNRRPISIASIRDRIVQRAILNVIWVQIRDRVCTPASFGGVGKYYKKRKSLDLKASDPTKNVQAAATEIIALRRQGFNWVFETDIEKFFPSIDRTLLLGMLFPLLTDDSLCNLIEAFLDTAIVNAAQFPVQLVELWNPEQGVPQGGILSPVLANLYLYNFDLAVAKAGYKMVRYVDDLIILTKSKNDARAAYNLCQKTLQDQGLHIHPLEKRESKTNILSPQQSFEFLGLTVNTASLRPSPKSFEKVRERILRRTHIRLTSRSSLIEVAGQVNRLLTGWVKAYSFCNISKHELRELDDLVGKRIRHWLECHKVLRKRQPLCAKARDALGLIRAEKTYVKPIMMKNQS